MNIKLSQYTPRKAEGTIIILKVRILTKNITLEDLNSDVLLAMRKDTMPEIVLEIRVTLTRKRETRKDIMLILQRMINLS